MLYIAPSPAVPSIPKRPLVCKALTRESVSLEWNEPEHDGGSKILGYMIEKREPTRLSWSRVMKSMNEDTKVKIEQLIEGSDFYFRVAAFNKIGTGEFLELPDPVKIKSPYGI